MRKPISPRLRFSVLSRDGYRCTYCGATAAEAKLHIDHIIAVARGGETTLENLTTACVLCNQGKADTAASPPIRQNLEPEWDVLLARGREIGGDAFAEYKRDVFGSAWTEMCSIADRVALFPGNPWEEFAWALDSGYWGQTASAYSNATPECREFYRNLEAHNAKIGLAGKGVTA